MQDDNLVGLELKDYISIIKKRFYIPIIISIISLVIPFVYTHYFMKTTYDANMSLLVGNSNKSTQFNYDDLLLDQNLVKTYAGIASTSKIMEDTIKKLGLNISPNELQQRITIDSDTDTLMLQLKVNWDTPKESVKIANEFSNVLIEEIKKIYNVDNIQVIDNAQTSVKRPNKVLYEIFSFIIGILCSSSLIFAMEFLNNKINTQEDIEKYLNANIIGNIPNNKKLSSPIINKGNLIKVPSFCMEAYKTLRMNIQFICESKGIKTITVTSSMAGEGKTILASMLAAVLAQAGKKTLLIDGDFRNSKVYKLFNFREENGLRNILEWNKEPEAVIHKSDIENLFIITSGTKPFSPTELLGSMEMKELIKKLKGEFDYVIIDSPYLGQVADAQLMAEITDGCLMVAGSGEVEKKLLIKANGLLKTVNANLIGISLNKVKEKQTKIYEVPNGSNTNKGFVVSRSDR